MRTSVRLIFPFFILVLLLVILCRELFYANPTELPSSLIGKPMPTFNLSSLYNARQTFSDKTVRGQPALINIWATWCYACQLEMPMLLAIKENYHIPIYGIVYKDDRSLALKWLKQYGNPYTAIGMDNTGDTAIDFGVYGTPETFVINPQGRIIYRHAGLLDQKSWEEVIYPLIKKFEHAL